MLAGSNVDAGSGGAAALVGTVAGLSGREKLHRRTRPKALTQRAPRKQGTQRRGFGHQEFGFSDFPGIIATGRKFRFRNVK